MKEVNVEPTSEELREIYRKLISAKSTNENMAKIKAIVAQLKRRGEKVQISYEVKGQPGKPVGFKLNSQTRKDTQ